MNPPEDARRRWGEHPGDPARRRAVLLIAASVLFIGFVTGLIFYKFNPQQSWFYPKCPFYAVTGLLCPGCGSLRAIHQLVHGHFLEAIRLNALLVLVLLPVTLWAAIRFFAYQTMGKQLPALFLKRVGCWVLLVFVVLFGILRNV